MLRCLLVAAALLLASGCMPDSAGVSPPSDRFFYPTAASLTPDGDHLAVASSNFDLAYSNGTVLVIDLDRVLAELVSGCPDEGCEPVEESPFVLEDETVRTGSYASFLERTSDGTRMYLTVRGDTSLTYLDMDAGAEPGLKLTCFDRDDPPKGRKCDSDHRVTSGLNADPYAITIKRESYPHEGTGGETVVDWIFVTHLTSGQLSVFEAEVNPLERDIAPRHVLQDNSFPQGISSVQLHPLTSSTFYAATRHSTTLLTFTFATDPADFGSSTRIAQGRTIPLSVVSDGHDSRDLVFSHDGSMAYVSNRSPNSLVIIDTSVDAYGWPRNQVVGAVELDSGPSLVEAWSPPGWDQEWVYVTCYNKDRIYVIDPVLRTPVDVILTGNGPHVMVTDPERLLGYLVNFIESTVSVIDLDPASATFNDIRATLGIPEKARRND
jgi:DNA-binding beta-propeller fold protein YncE